MPGDYTRVTFNPFEDHLGVLMQQGRVLLDADFNEQVEILDRRFRAETIDIIGRCVVPRETPDGFRIQIAGNSITIGRGRLYAHGLLAENHGTGALEFDPILAEERGVDPIPYEEQPYLPDALAFGPAPGQAGQHLVYLDVWQRELTAIEEPDLVEKAVGVDATTRLQTVWQVKVLSNLPAGITCSTPGDQIPGWLDIVRPSAGRLTTSAVGIPASTDPCVVNPTGGFRGTENRLYRVEVHDGGDATTATLKWSRDNASIATAVTVINAGLDVLTVARTGRDAVLRFEPGDWVEVTDDRHELHGLRGEMRKVQLVDDVTQSITLETPLTANEFNDADPGAGHTRVRRWDHKGQVLDSNNAVVADVDASGGVIPIPAAGSFVLEDGVQVTLSTDPAGGEFHVGDYWVFAARTADASIEVLDAAPPRGIHHHFCRLALVTFPQIVVDCRTFWPPEFEGGGCDCTECVSAESHNSGAFTIQMAVDRVRSEGGKVCLGPGVFNLGVTPVQINGVQSVQIEGHGWKTLLVYGGNGAAVHVRNSIGVDITSLSVFAVAIEVASHAVAVTNSMLVQMERLFLAVAGQPNGSSCIALSGVVAEARIRDNTLFGTNGIVSLASGVNNPAGAVANTPTYALTFGLYVEDNLILSQRRGISMEGLTLHLGETRLQGNTIYGSPNGAIAMRGLVGFQVTPSSRLDVKSNEVLCSGDAVVFSTDNARINDNDISAPRATDDDAPASQGDGIVFEQSLLKSAGDCQVMGNRISRLSGDGISIRGALRSAMIKNNVIDSVGGGAIVMEEGGQAEQLSIENNQILNVGLAANPDRRLAAIRVSRTLQVDVTGNSISGFAPSGVPNPSRFGIEVAASSSVRIVGNDLVRIGPATTFLNVGAGVWVQGPYDRADVVDNSVRRALGLPGAADSSVWYGVRITRLRGSSLTTSAGATATRAGDYLFPYIVDISDTQVLAVGSNLAVVLPRGREVAAVRGNLVEGYGRVPVVDVDASGLSVLSDNRCSVVQSPTTPSSVADLRAGAAVVSANHLERAPASDNIPALRLTVGNGPSTVLGNIARGHILVNNAPLAAPWSPLNVIVF